MQEQAILLDNLFHFPFPWLTVGLGFTQLIHPRCPRGKESLDIVLTMWMNEWMNECPRRIWDTLLQRKEPVLLCLSSKTCFNSLGHKTCFFGHLPSLCFKLHVRKKHATQWRKWREEGTIVCWKGGRWRVSCCSTPKEMCVVLAEFALRAVRPS